MRTKKLEKVEPKVARFRLKELKPAKDNPRVISDDALAGLSVSIQKFGCVEVLYFIPKEKTI